MPETPKEGSENGSLEFVSQSCDEFHIVLVTIGCGLIVVSVLDKNAQA
jgi:hypothetical protein